MPDADSTEPRFQGSFLYGIDGARRVVCPPKWRPKNPDMVFTGILWPIGVGTHLLVLPPRRFEVMVSKLEQMSLSDEHAAALERWLGSNSGELTFDSANRFTVPENLASQAGLADQAQYVGRLDKFEMWNPDRFEANQREDGAKLAAAVRQINL